MSVSSVFVLLFVYSAGNAWAAVFPKASCVEGSRFEGLAPFLNLINPGKFSLKEVIIFDSFKLFPFDYNESKLLACYRYSRSFYSGRR